VPCLHLGPKLRAEWKGSRRFNYLRSLISTGTKMHQILVVKPIKLTNP
jgi:hypothetical protein